MPFYPLEKLHRLHEGYCKHFRVAGRKLLLIQSNDQTHLIDDKCPHAGSSLRKSTIASDVIRCPAHGICFSLSTGRPEGGGIVADISSLTRYPLVQEGDMVGVKLE